MRLSLKTYKPMLMLVLATLSMVSKKGYCQESDAVVANKSADRAVTIFGLRNPHILNRMPISISNSSNSTSLISDIFRQSGFQTRIKDYYDQFMNQNHDPTTHNLYWSTKSHEQQANQRKTDLLSTMGQGGADAFLQTIKQHYPMIDQWSQGLKGSFSLSDLAGSLHESRAENPDPVRYGLLLQDIEVNKVAAKTIAKPRYTIGPKPLEQPLQKVTLKSKSETEPSLTSYMPDMRFHTQLRPEPINGKPAMKFEIYQINRYYEMSAPIEMGSGMGGFTHTARTPLGECRDVSRRYKSTGKAEETRLSNMGGNCQGLQWHAGLQHDYNTWYTEQHLIQFQKDYRIRTTFEQSKPKQIEIWVSQWL